MLSIDYKKKYFKYKEKYFKLKKQYGGSFLDEDIFNLDDLFTNIRKEENKDKIILTIENIILTFQIEILLKEKFKINKLDNLEFKNIRTEDVTVFFNYLNSLSPDKLLKSIFEEHSYCYLEKIINKINSLDKHTIEFNTIPYDIFYHIVDKNLKYSTYNLHLKTEFFNISFSKTFKTDFENSNITRSGTTGTNTYNYTGLWCSTDKHFLQYYLERAIQNLRTDSSRINHFYPSISTFKIKKNIPNMLIVDDTSLHNVKILENLIILLKKKIPDIPEWNIYKELYINSGLHRKNNYLFAWMINKINEVNPCEPDNQINGWICLPDSSEIFIINTKEYLELVDYTNIEKIYTENRENGQKQDLIYYKQKLYNNYETIFMNYLILENPDSQINMNINTTEELLPEIIMIGEHYINISSDNFN